MTQLAYNRMAMSPESYKARQEALMKACGVNTLEECVQHLRRTVIMNGREVRVVFKRRFKNLMVK